MQNKTIMRYHYVYIRISKIKETEHARYWQGCGATGIFMNENGSTTLEKFIRFLEILTHHMTKTFHPQML